MDAEGNPRYHPHDASGHVAMDLKSTDWRLKAGHSLAVEIGTVYDGAWIDTPTGDRIKVTDVRLGRAVRRFPYRSPRRGGPASVGARRRSRRGRPGPARGRTW